MLELKTAFLPIFFHKGKQHAGPDFFPVPLFYSLTREHRRWQDQCVNFSAIDFETANANRASICAVGAVRVEGGKIVDEIHRLINPCCVFSPLNIAVHGINPFDVRFSPRFDQLFGEIKPFLEGVVVAHNAPFDMSCLCAALEKYDIAPPDFDYLCTLSISRKAARELPCHRLDFLAKHYRLGAFNHHNALDDAKMCAKIFSLFCEKTDVENMKKPFRKKAADMRERRSETFFSPRGKTARPTTIHAGEPQNKFEFDYSPVNFRKNFAIAGDFGDLDARYIKSLICRQGGNFVSVIDQTTDYLTVANKPFQPRELSAFTDKISSALAFGKTRFLSLPHFLKEIM